MSINIFQLIKMPKNIFQLIKNLKFLIKCYIYLVKNIFQFFVFILFLSNNFENFMFNYQNVINYNI